MRHLGALLGAQRETRASLLITEMKRNKHPAVRLTVFDVRVKVEDNVGRNFCSMILNIML